MMFFFMFQLRICCVKIVDESQEFFSFLMCSSLAERASSMVCFIETVPCSQLISFLSFSLRSRLSFLRLSIYLMKDSLRASLSSWPWLTVLLLNSYFFACKSQLLRFSIATSLLNSVIWILLCLFSSTSLSNSLLVLSK